MDTEDIIDLYRRGYLAAAVEASRQTALSGGGEAWAAMVGVRALMEMGDFTEAGKWGTTAAAEFSGANAVLLTTYAAYAAMMLHPCARSRGSVRTELDSLATYTDPRTQAVSQALEARLLAAEINFFVRPWTQIPAVVAGFEKAALLFTLAKRHNESRGELLLAASYLLKGPRSGFDRARAILQQVLAEGGDQADLPAVAKASLALAELDFEDAMRTAANPDSATVARLLASFDEALVRYNEAKMAAGEAEVRAAAGRGLLRYGMPPGVDELRKAAEIWEAAGQHAAADGVWRDLHRWHYQRAEREEVEKLEEKLCAAPAIAGHLAGATSAVQLAHAAFARGNYAEALEISRATRRIDLEPGPLAALLLMECSALAGSGDRDAAARVAIEAVALLRPAEPCRLLADAVFHLGCHQAQPDELFRRWQEAADIDTACGANMSAAQRYANMAEQLSQAGTSAVLPDGRNARDLFQQASDRVEGCDRDSLVLSGNIAQRRGIVAERDGDLEECVRSLVEAEACFRKVVQVADLAFTLAHQGLTLLKLARLSASFEKFESARGCLVEASGLFQRQDLANEEFRMERHAAIAAWEGGNVGSEEDRPVLYDLAQGHMAAAARLMELLRRGRQESDLFARQGSLDHISSEMEPFLEESFRFHLNVLRRPADALAWLERGKSRGLLDSLAALEPALPPHLNTALAAELESLATERRSLSGHSYTNRRRCKELTSRLEQLWQTMAARPESAAYGALRLGLPMDWPRWQRELRDQQALPEAARRNILSVHFAWPQRETDPIRLIACRGDWEAPRAAAVSPSRRSVETFLHQCFGGMDRSSPGAWLKMAGGDQAWCSRFAPLIAPLADWSQPDDIVILIPQGPLHSLPLHALSIGGQPLAERNPVTFAPSAAILGVCWQRGQQKPDGKSAVFGCPDPGPGFALLPRSVEEAEFVANLLGTSAVISNAISPDDFRRAITDASTVHFAGHATEAASGWDSGLQLGAESVFTALDFFNTSLAADIFTLSGCRTARNRRRRGDEILGLIPSLLYAGASSVLASQWEAADDATALMMKHFYDAHRGPRQVGKAEAFRAAVTRTRHEFPALTHWATFTLHGDWK